MLENIGNTITYLAMDQLGRNLAGRMPSRFRHVRRKSVATPLPSNGALDIQQLWALEAERVNQFWWNLVYNSKFGQQWQSRDQILKFLKFKMADGRHVRKYWKCHYSPSNGPIGTKRGWSHPVTFPICPPWCGCYGNGRCLATAHWTFSYYGCLEAKRVNQFLWNLVYNSKLRPQ